MYYWNHKTSASLSRGSLVVCPIPPRMGKVLVLKSGSSSVLSSVTNDLCWSTKLLNVSGTCGSGAADDSNVELFVEDGTLVDDVDELGTGSAPFGVGFLSVVVWATLVRWRSFMHASWRRSVVLSTLSGRRVAEDRLTAKWVSPVASVITSMTSHWLIIDWSWLVMQVMTGHQRLAGHDRTTLGLHYAPYRSERELLGIETNMRIKMSTTWLPLVCVQALILRLGRFLKNKNDLVLDLSTTGEWCGLLSRARRAQLGDCKNCSV